MNTIVNSCLTIGCALALSATQLHAECNGSWDMTGEWQFIQSNKYTAKFDLHQDGSAISGKGYFDDGKDTKSSGRFGRYWDGTVSGSISENAFNFVVVWSGVSRGAYQGVIDGAGNIAGTTFDMNQPNSKAGWHANRLVTCIAAAAPTHTLGKRPTAQELSTSAAAIDNQDSVMLPVAPVGPTATSLNDVDIYEGPDGSYAIIGVMAGNFTAPVLGEATGWYLLELPIAKSKGWVAADHLTITR